MDSDAVLDAFRKSIDRMSIEERAVLAVMVDKVESGEASADEPISVSVEELNAKLHEWGAA